MNKDVEHFADALRRAQELFPHLRIGQIIENAKYLISNDSKNFIFYVDNKTLIEAINKFSYDKVVEMQESSTEAITVFEGEYRFLSNFYFPVEIKEYLGPNHASTDLVYTSTEAAYQAAKFLNKDIRARFVTLKPNEAKKLGRGLGEIRSDWNTVKVDIMTNLLKQKFAYPELREKLLATGDKRLEEGNWWGDIYWGTCGGSGLNWLGFLLMNLRKELRDNAR